MGRYFLFHPALEMNGVSWRVGRHTVLSDVSLAVKPGELLGVKVGIPEAVS